MCSYFVALSVLLALICSKEHVQYGYEKLWSISADCTVLRLRNCVCYRVKEKPNSTCNTDMKCSLYYSSVVLTV